MCRAVAHSEVLMAVVDRRSFECAGVDAGDVLRRQLRILPSKDSHEALQEPVKAGPGGIAKVHPGDRTISNFDSTFDTHSRAEAVAVAILPLVVSNLLQLLRQHRCDSIEMRHQREIVRHVSINRIIDEEHAAASVS